MLQQTVSVHIKKDLHKVKDLFMTVSTQWFKRCIYVNFIARFSIICFANNEYSSLLSTFIAAFDTYRFWIHLTISSITFDLLFDYSSLYMCIQTNPVQYDTIICPVYRSIWNHRLSFLKNNQFNSIVCFLNRWF